MINAEASPLPRKAARFGSVILGVRREGGEGTLMAGLGGEDPSEIDQADGGGR